MFPGSRQLSWKHWSRDDVGQWEGLLGTEMPEQQEYELFTHCSERHILWQVLRLGWGITHVCVCNNLINWEESGIWGAVGCWDIQHHTW